MLALQDLPTPSLANQVMALDRALNSPLLQMTSQQREGERNRLLILDHLAVKQRTVSQIAIAVGMTREAVHQHLVRMAKETPPRTKIVKAVRPAVWGVA